MNLQSISSKKCFLFDLDGTLIDTKAANLNSYQAALNDFELHVSLNSLEETWGMDSTLFIPKLFPEVLIEPELVKRIQQRKSKYYPNYFKDSFPNFPLISLICLSKNFNMKTGLVTTSKSNNAIRLLEFHGLYELFDFFVFGEDTENGKPSPEPYLKAVEISGVPSSAHLVFEDSETGITSAVLAGLDVVKVGMY